MKTLSFIILTILLSCSHQKSSRNLYSATHYKKYQPTPDTPYKESILDFYSRSKAYGEFSNFALFPITVDGKLWPTSEHYYQAHKYSDPKLQEWVRLGDTPVEAAKRGRDKSKPKRKDWDQVKDGIMEKALVAKFTQHEVLKKLLLATGDSALYEHTKNDCYWGDCGDRSGKNKLGKALMKIRGQLRANSL